MKEIPLTQGKVALVDDADFDRVNQFNWCAKKGQTTWYAHRRNGKTTLLLHQFILPGHKRIDHKDGDGLNNQRNNLRPATRAENKQNSNKQINNTSGYKGVFSNGGSRWRAQIRVKRILRHVGYFSNKKSCC